MHYAKYVWPDIANAELGVDEVEGFPGAMAVGACAADGQGGFGCGANRGGWSRLLARRFERVCNGAQSGAAWRVAVDCRNGCCAHCWGRGGLRASATL